MLNRVSYTVDIKVYTQIGLIVIDDSEIYKVREADVNCYHCEISVAYKCPCHQMTEYDGGNLLLKCLSHNELTPIDLKLVKSLYVIRLLKSSNNVVNIIKEI